MYTIYHGISRDIKMTQTPQGGVSLASRYFEMWNAGNIANWIETNGSLLTLKTL